MASSHYWAAGKSIRACQAEAEGKYPATTFKKVYGIDPRPICSPCEWHHTSKMFNRTDYYQLSDVFEKLAAMPHERRKQYIGRGKFRQIWLQNRFNYLSYEKPRPTFPKDGISVHLSEGKIDIFGQPNERKVRHAIRKLARDRAKLYSQVGEIETSLILFKGTFFISEAAVSRSLCYTYSDRVVNRREARYEEIDFSKWHLSHVSGSGATLYFSL